jgi:uncharacterized membrane protein
MGTLLLVLSLGCWAKRSYATDLIKIEYCSDRLPTVSITSGLLSRSKRTYPWALISIYFEETTVTTGNHPLLIDQSL